MHASRVRSDELRFCRHMANKAVRALDVHARTGAPAPFDIPTVCDAETLDLRELALDPAVCTIGAAGSPAAPGAEKGTPKWLEGFVPLPPALRRALDAKRELFYPNENRVRAASVNVQTERSRSEGRMPSQDTHRQDVSQTLSRHHVARRSRFGNAATTPADGAVRLYPRGHGQGGDHVQHQVRTRLNLVSPVSVFLWIWDRRIWLTYCGRVGLGREYKKDWRRLADDPSCLPLTNPYEKVRPLVSMRCTGRIPRRAHSFPMLAVCSRCTPVARL
jgi:hypothetical protein